MVNAHHATQGLYLRMENAWLTKIYRMEIPFVLNGQKILASDVLQELIWDLI